MAFNERISPPTIASINRSTSSPNRQRQQKQHQRRQQPSLSSITFADEISLIDTTPPTLNPFDFETSSRAQGLGISAGTPLLNVSKDDFSTTAESPLITPAPSHPYLSPRADQYDYSYDRGGAASPALHGDEGDLSTGKNTPFQDDYPGRTSSDRIRGIDVSPSLRTEDGDDLPNSHDGCPSKRDIHSSRRNWLSISILALSIYSTVFSGIYLIIALKQPRYGKQIMSGGKFTPETASVLFALFAKTIELSFVSVFVAFLGQVLSRRSLIKGSRGVSVAELTMRNWVIQPAFMITHWETMRHAGLTFLGMLALTNAFVAMFYTTASDSLVSPHLKFGQWHRQGMVGAVRTNYAVPAYVSTLCHNPTTYMDPVFYGTTCLAVLHAGQAHSNHITFLESWTRAAADGGVDAFHRPEAPAMLFDNTTVTGSWVYKEWSNMTWSYSQFNRVIDNVTMAMPHAGVFAAARHEKNEIMQPENLAGVGEYRVRASVISPAVNVLCVNLNETELAPLIYVTWPNANYTTGVQIPGQRMPVPGDGWLEEAIPAPGEDYLNSTVVDDIFEWGPRYLHQPPAFPMYPMDYNSILNVSVPYAFTDSIYVLFKAPDVVTKHYTMCKLRSILVPQCSTHYNVSGTTGGQMRSNCDDPNDAMAYKVSVLDAPTIRAKDWINIGSELVRALALGTGVSNANASSSRLVAQLVTKEPSDGMMAERNRSMPSISESLAVMAGSSLLLSSTDATFYHFWNFTNATLDHSVLLPFNATIQSQQYTSGIVQRWTAIFYVILIIVFVTNLFCLCYFFIRSGLVTDYSEPQNLFALAINSPVSRRLFGSCGAGPEGGQFNVDWHVLLDDGSGHFFIKEGDRDEELLAATTTNNTSLRQRAVPGQLKSVNSYSKLSSQRKSWL